VKDYELIVNVFRAKVTPEEEGYLVLDVTGAEENIQRSMDFVKTFDVTINLTGKGVMRDAEICTHCGHCITHCPTRALHIADAFTREVEYDETKCIECLACIRVCPFNACSSAF
jgi:ferredoxin